MSMMMRAIMTTKMVVDIVAVAETVEDEEVAMLVHTEVAGRATRILGIRRSIKVWEQPTGTLRPACKK